MKILRIISSVNPEGGGPIEGLKQSSAILSQQEHSIEIASLDLPEENYLDYFPFPVFALGSNKSGYSYSRKFSNWLNSHVGDYDVVLVHGMWQFSGLAARHACMKQGVPYYVFTHGMLDPWFKNTYPLKHLKKWLYWPWAEYRVLRDAQRVFFTTEEERQLARQSFWLYKCNEYVINYGTAGHAGSISQQKEIFIKQYPNLKGKKYLLYLSRIHPKKGVDILIKAFADLQPKLGEVELVIAGPDKTNWKPELIKLAVKYGVQDKITWPGMLKGDLKWGAYHCADAFILPSHQENFGIVVAEALSCSLPVLISNKVNIWREIQEDNAGFSSNDTFEGCREIIDRWLQTNKQGRELMQKNSKKSFSERFEIHKSAASLIEAITG